MYQFSFKKPGFECRRTSPIMSATPCSSCKTQPTLPDDQVRTQSHDWHAKLTKALARGGKGTTSVLVVSLVDVHIFELARQGTSQGYTSFAHTFVLGIGPEGVVVWQSWGEHGYGLDEYISRGDARIRSWQEAGDFVDVFGNFAAYEVSISASCFAKEVMLTPIAGQVGR